jgi:hypothetical protein
VADPSLERPYQVSWEGAEPTVRVICSVDPVGHIVGPDVDA